METEGTSQNYCNNKQSSQMIENDSEISMQEQKTKRINHEIIDNEIYNSEEDTNTKIENVNKIVSLRSNKSRQNKKNKFFNDKNENLEGIRLRLKDIGKIRHFNIPNIDNSPRSKDTFKAYSTNANTPRRHKNRLREKIK